MKKYQSLFRIKFLNGLQYRAAALAGCSTQFFWGIMSILMYMAFYKANPDNFPMEFPALTSYIWIQQAFLMLFNTWLFDNDIFDSISSGNVAYELCRPLDLYSMWLVRNIAERFSKTILRSLPILALAIFLPKPYGITFPPSFSLFLMFIISMFFTTLLVSVFTMLVYITSFFTISSMGIRILSISIVEFFSGFVIPIPFFPYKLQTILSFLPFTYMQNIPLRIYSGDIKGINAINGMIMQIVWIFILVFIGKLIMKKALKRVVIQGG